MINCTRKTSSSKSFYTGEVSGVVSGAVNSAVNGVSDVCVHQC